MSAVRLTRLWLLTQRALREAAHLRLGWVVVLTAAALVGGASVLDEFNFGAERSRFLTDFAEGTLAVFGTALGIMLPVALLHGVPDRELGPLLVCGVRRSEWLLSRLLAAWVALAWLALVVLLLAVWMLWPGPAGAVAALAGRFALVWLRLALVAGFTLTFCCLSRSPLLAVLLSVSFTMAAHLAPVIAWSRQPANGASRAGWTVLDALVPDFAVFDATTSASAAGLYAAGYAALCFLVACLAFSRREL